MITMINIFTFLSFCVFVFVRPLFIIPALIGAAAAIGGGLIASHASKKNTKKANDANLKATIDTNNANIAMNRENNELQMKLARESNAISQDQFNQMMDYQKNAYTYTSQDLARAGLNPALLASGGVSASSSPSSTSVDTPRVNAGSAHCIFQQRKILCFFVSLCLKLYQLNSSYLNIYCKRN